MRYYINGNEVDEETLWEQMKDCVDNEIDYRFDEILNDESGHIRIRGCIFTSSDIFREMEPDLYRREQETEIRERLDEFADTFNSEGVVTVFGDLFEMRDEEDEAEVVSNDDWFDEDDTEE